MRKKPNRAPEPTAPSGFGSAWTLGKKMRLSLLLVSVIALAGRSDPIERALEKEDVVLESEISDPAGNRILQTETTLMFLENQLHQHEASSEKEALRISRDIRRRLAVGRMALENWKEFCRPLLPGDRVFQVRTRNRRISYYVAIRHGKQWIGLIPKFSAIRR